MTQEHRCVKLDNPLFGDAWHIRDSLKLIVIGIVDNFVLVSKAYNNSGFSCIKAEEISFVLLTREEFTDTVKRCDVISNSKYWLSFYESMNLPVNLLDHKHVKKLFIEKTAILAN